jgi:hypothetical protein
MQIFTIRLAVSLPSALLIPTDDSLITRQAKNESPAKSTMTN